jgi:hypothetical protein
MQRANPEPQRIVFQEPMRDTFFINRPLAQQRITPQLEMGIEDERQRRRMLEPPAVEGIGRAPRLTESAEQRLRITNHEQRYFNSPAGANLIIASGERVARQMLRGALRRRDEGLNNPEISQRTDRQMFRRGGRIVDNTEVREPTIPRPARRFGNPERRVVPNDSTEFREPIAGPGRRFGNTERRVVPNDSTEDRVAFQPTMPRSARRF